jgi:hypothetical protein
MFTGFHGVETDLFEAHGVANKSVCGMTILVWCDNRGRDIRPAGSIGVTPRAIVGNRAPAKKSGAVREP